MKTLLLITALMLTGCSITPKYEFFVKRDRLEICIEDDNGNIIGYSNRETGNEYVLFESETLTVHTYKTSYPAKRHETHIVVGQYYYASNGDLVADYDL